MSYIDNLEELKVFLKIKDTKNGVKHFTNHGSNLLPFTTSEPERAKFKNGFKSIIGELSRLITNTKIDKEFDLEKFIIHLGNNIEIDEDDKVYFYKLIREHLINDQSDINITHPYFFKLIKENKNKEGKGEKEIALFIRDVLFDTEGILMEYFNNKNDNDIITKLVLCNIDILENEEIKKKYNNNLVFIKDILKEDIEFLSQHKEFLMKNLELLLGYYYFFYITQLTIKLNKGSIAQYEKCEEIYYLLDKETINKNRTSTTKGYSFIKEEGKNLLLNINVLEHLNILLGTVGLNYKKLEEEFRILNENQKSEFLKVLKEWIFIYREKIGAVLENQASLDYHSLTKLLKESLDIGLKKATKSRYYLSLEAIGKKYFMKSRGSYGFTLNISQDFLILMTAISIKEEKIKLQDLFFEYEKRGLFLDNYSKDEVIKILGNLNLIDKKSDSGDGQYVKSIL